MLDGIIIEPVVILYNNNSSERYLKKIVSASLFQENLHVMC